MNILADHADGEDSGALPHFDILGSVADEAAAGGRCVQDSEGAGDSFGMRLAIDDILVTNDGGEGEVEPREFLADAVAIGAGDDPELKSGGAAVVDDGEGAGKEVRLLAFVVLEPAAIAQAPGFLGEIEGLIHAVPGGGVDLLVFVEGKGEAEIGKGFFEGAVEGGAGIAEGPVPIEEDSTEGHEFSLAQIRDRSLTVAIRAGG